MTLTKGFHKHHIVPRYLGGSDESDNLVLLHPIDHAIWHLVRYKMHGNIGDLRSANLLLKHIDGEAFSYECNAGENNPNYGNVYSIEVRNKIRQSKLGVKQSAETIARRVAKTTGQKRPKQSLALSGVNNPNYGKPMSDETKARLSATQKARLAAKKEQQSA